MGTQKNISVWIDRLENWILVWTILALAMMGFVQVITRYCFHYSFSWFEEAGRYLGIFITFFGAAIGVKSSSHFAMDFFVRRLKRPWQNRLRALTAVIAGLFCFFVVWYSCKIVLRLHGFGSTTPAMQLPMFMVYLPIPFFSLVMGFRYLWQAIMLWKESDEPSTVGAPQK